jgi:hypothetical protein
MASAANQRGEMANCVALSEKLAVGDISLKASSEGIARSINTKRHRRKKSVAHGSGAGGESWQ